MFEENVVSSGTQPGTLIRLQRYLFCLKKTWILWHRDYNINVKRKDSMEQSYMDLQVLYIIAAALITTILRTSGY